MAPRVLALLLAIGAAGLHAQSSDKKIFLSVVDAAGSPVTGITAEEFAVREDGVERQVVDVATAKEPLHVALLVDTTAATEPSLPKMREGLIAFTRALLTASPDSKVGVWEFGLAAQRIRDFTSDAARLEKDLGNVFPRANAGSVLLEAIYRASEALSRRPGERRAIVVFNVEPTAELTDRQAQEINQSLMRSRAQLWILSLQRGALENGPRDALLATFTRNAGGMRNQILTDTPVERYMRQYAAALAAQYELTYRRPSGTAKVAQTGIRRDGVKMIAGLFAPQ